MRSERDEINPDSVPALGSPDQRPRESSQTRCS